jgi:hypothetical protein
MNNQITTTNDIVDQINNDFEEQIFVRKFKDKTGGLHEFRIKSRNVFMKDFDKSKFKLIVERNGNFEIISKESRSSAIDKFKLSVFNFFQLFDFYQFNVSEINSGAIRSVFFIEDNQIEVEFCAVLNFYTQNQKS